MADKQIDLLRRDECQPLTNEQMNDIKSQFHPSNTANVNIVPYEIYDEDGEEIVVGEVRKTIDGVKKKKPVYKKIITSPDMSQTMVTNVDTLIDYKCLRTPNNIDVTYKLIADPGYGGDGAGAIFPTLTNGTLKIALWGGSYNGTISWVSFKYTKTNDEWTAI